MHRKLSSCFAMIVAAAVIVDAALLEAPAAFAGGQMMPGGPGQMPGRVAFVHCPRGRDEQQQPVGRETRCRRQKSLQGGHEIAR